jgi:hypothetical protein
MIVAKSREVLCYENGPTPTENKQFTARLDADPIFMLGGAPTAHEVLSDTGSHSLPQCYSSSWPISFPLRLERVVP